MMQVEQVTEQKEANKNIMSNKVAVHGKMCCTQNGTYPSEP